MPSRGSIEGNTPAVHPRFAYLLLTHKLAQHVEELAARIVELSPAAEIVVHHDLGAHDVPWGGDPSGRVHLVERGRVLWGDWSMVDATLRLLRFALEELDADWFVLLSGEHRPIVDLEGWERSTAQSGLDAFVAADQLSSRLRFGRADPVANQYLARAQHRWVTFPRPRSELVHRAIGALMKVSCSLHPIAKLEYAHRREAWALGIRRRRGSMRGQTFFRGSQWMVLGRRAAEAALDVDPGLSNWFKESWIPDETYFHTVLRSTPGLVLSNQPVTFVLDTPARPTRGWMRLGLQDLPAVWASGAPFARKVDPSASPEVLTAIDRAVDMRARPR